MRLIHFSTDPLAGVWPVVQLSEPSPKPKGLWVSDEDGAYGWREWCLSENYRVEGLAVAHEITLTEGANILRISDADGIDSLTREYRAAEYERDGYRLHWDKIAEQWQGILITPYIGERRLAFHTGWYYPWDCASGCIWDTDAIAGFEVVDLPPLPEEDW